MAIPQRSTPLKKYIWLLIVLNALDGFLTYIGLTRGIVTEANPLLSSLAPLSILGIKLILSLCLFALLFTAFSGVRSNFWRATLFGANAIYFMILALHMVWLPYLFS